MDLFIFLSGSQVKHIFSVWHLLGSLTVQTITKQCLLGYEADGQRSSLKLYKHTLLYKATSLDDIFTMKTVNVYVRLWNYCYKNSSQPTPVIHNSFRWESMLGIYLYLQVNYVYVFFFFHAWRFLWIPGLLTDLTFVPLVFLKQCDPVLWFSLVW